MKGLFIISLCGRHVYTNYPKMLQFLLTMQMLVNIDINLSNLLISDWNLI